MVATKTRARGLFVLLAFGLVCHATALRAADWEPTTTDLLRTEKPGYGGLLVTTDKGATWKRAGDIKDGRYGPIFGKDARHLLVLTGAGIVESTDGGAIWSKPVALPREMKGVSPLTWIEYDPLNDILYAMKMTSELYRMIR